MIRSLLLLALCLVCASAAAQGEPPSFPDGPPLDSGVAATVTVTATADATEGAADGTFEISIDETLSSDLEVTFSTSGDTNDASALGATATILAGDTSVEVTVVANDDAVVEAGESITLTLLSTNSDQAVVGAPSVAAVAVLDNDSATLIVTASDAAEPGTDGAFTILSSATASFGVDITVEIGGTATEGDDFGAIGTSVTLEAGQTTVLVPIEVEDDNAFEGDETVTLTLASTDAVAVTVGAPSTATASITDDDNAPAVVLTAAETTVLEGAGTQVTATLTGSTAVTDVIVFLSTTGDGSRFSIADEIVIPAGQTTASVPFVATDKDGDQTDLEVAVSISAVTGAMEVIEQVAMILVQDSDPTLVSLSASPLRIAEDGGVSVLTATLTTPAPSPVKVSLSFSTSSADGSDYTATATEIVIAENEATGTATITAMSDGLEGEGDETLAVSITDVSGGDLEDGTQENGDQSVEITFQEAPSVATAEFSRVQTSVLEGSGSVRIDVALDRALAAPATIRVLLESGASADLDGFTMADVLVPARTATASVTVTITDDQKVESNEVFRFSLEVVSGDLEVADGASTALVVVDNDGPSVTVVVSMRDADGDGLEDGGPRFFSVPVGGLTAGDVAAAAGGAVSIIASGTGVLAPVGANETLLAGQLIMVDVAPGADLSFIGSAASVEIAYEAIVLESRKTGGANPDVRVLVPVANLTDAAIPVGSLSVEGGALSDVALVFDEAAGTFRPVSLSSVGASGLSPLDGMILQVIPSDLDAPAVTMTHLDGDAPDGSDVAQWSFMPMAGETAVVLSLRPSASSGRLPASAPSDVVVLRVLEDAAPGLDRFDGAAVSTSSVDLAFDGGLPLSALSANPSALEGGLDLELNAQAGTGSYEIAADVLGDLDLDVFVVDNGTVVRLTEPYAFTVANGDDLSNRFALRVAPRITVANEDAALEGAVGRIFPNPTASAAWLDLEVEAQAVRAEVFDLLGRSVARIFNGAHVGGALRLEVDAGALAPGAYVIRVTGDSFSTTCRLSVVR